MKILLLLLFLALPTLAQTTQDLDKRNGFRHFTLKQDISEIKNIAEQKNRDYNPRVKNYVYLGDDLSHLFTVPVDEVSLSFYDNKLMGIQIFFTDLDNGYTNEEYQTINSSLEKLYGRNHFQPSADPFISKGTIWDGNNVVLEHLQVYYKEYIDDGYNPYQGYISIISKELMDKRMREEF